MTRRDVSKATLGRLPLYIKYLKGLPEDIKTVSATTVAKDLGFGEVGVRKDLASLCSSGRPKIGYIKDELTRCLEEYVAAETGSAVVVGAGKLGTALLEYTGFEEYGCSVLAAFDIKVTEPKKTSGGKEILPMEALPDFCRENKVNIGVIAVPADAAQSVLNTFCENGIKSIWSFAPVTLYKPEGVTVQYENLALSLAHLKSQINR
ncbi:MAG: redox-sensing transcriptional repressor Rex [Clostridia bacterium]|nr:redox-sensing transcriptional repressor Rex [Clostridia bacterium]